MGINSPNERREERAYVQGCELGEARKEGAVFYLFFFWRLCALDSARWVWVDDALGGYRRSMQMSASMVRFGWIF